MEGIILLVIGIVFVLCTCAIYGAAKSKSNSNRIKTILSEISALRRRLDDLTPPSVRPQPHFFKQQETAPQDTPPAPAAAPVATPPAPPVQDFSARAAAGQKESVASLHDALNIAKRTADAKQSHDAATEKPATVTPAPQPPVQPTPPATPAPKPSASPAAADTVVMAKVVLNPPKPAPRDTQANYDAPLKFTKKLLFKENSGELNVGKRLMAIGGFIILFITAIFFLRYMFNKGLITPAMQVGIIIAAGAVVAGLGNFFCIRKVQPLGQILTALGLAVTYAAFVAGMSDLYDPPVFGKTTAFICLSVVALYGMGVSLAFNTPVIAFLSLIAGFAVPPLVSTGQNHRDVLFIYMTILNVATLGLVFARQWRVLASVAMAGTYVLFVGWMNKHYSDEQSAGTLWWLIGFAVLFIAMNLSWNLRRRVPLAEYQVISLLVNGLAAIAISSFIFHGVNNENSAYFAWITGGVYMALGLLIRRMIPGDFLGRLSMFLLGLALVTYGVPLYFGERIIYLIWAFEGIMVLAVGWMYRNKMFKGISAAIMTLAYLAFIWAQMNFPRNPGDLPFINHFFGRFLIISVAAAGYGLTHGFCALRFGVLQYHKQLAVRILTLANLTITAGILIEYGLFADQNNIPDPTMMHFFTMVLLIQSLVFTGGGVRLKMAELATLGIIVLAAAGFCATGCFEDARPDRALILNTQFINALLWMVVSLYTAWDFKKRPEFSASLLTAKYLANLVAVAFWLLICQETFRYVRGTSGSTEAWLLAGKWMMTVWSVYAVLVLLAGTRFFVQSLRYIAMILMLIGIIAFFVTTIDRGIESSFGLMFLLAESVIVAMTARKTFDRLTGATSLATLAGAGVTVLVVYGASSNTLPLIINRAFLYALLWCTICGWLGVQVSRNDESDTARATSNLLYSVVVGALLVLLSYEAYRYVDMRLGYTADAGNAANITMTLVWAGYAAVMLTVGFIWRVRPLRYFALALLFIAGVKFILIDSVRFESLIRIIASFSIGVLMLVVAGAYHKLSAYIAQNGGDK